MSSFTIRAPKPLAPAQNWHYMQHLKDENLNELTVMPTQESIDDRHLEWVIPDVPYNRVHIKQYYSNFEIIEEGGHRKPVKKKVAPVVTIPEPVVTPAVRKKTLNPLEVKKLKTAIKEELDANGVDYPVTATLKVLQEIQAENK